MTAKAVILAAGRGARLKPITDNLPKVMVPVCGKPILEHHIMRLAKYGVRDIYINLHYLPEIIKKYFMDGARWGVKLTYSFEPIILGTAGAIKKLEAELDKDSFIVVYGDNYLELNYDEFSFFSEKKGGIATIAVFEKEDVQGSGILDIDENSRIKGFIEKPKPDEVYSHWVNAGVYYFRKEIFSLIEGTYSDFGFNVFPRIITSGADLFAYKMGSYVWAIDNVALLNEFKKNIQIIGKE